jgi:hypothetical protein
VKLLELRLRDCAHCEFAENLILYVFRFFGMNLQKQVDGLKKQVEFKDLQLVSF